MTNPRIPDAARHSNTTVSGEASAAMAKEGYQRIETPGKGVWPITHAVNSCGGFKARTSTAKYLWEVEA